MVRLTFVFATLLIVLGLVAYFGLSGDTKSVTALIPAFAGVLFALVGVVALKPGLRKHAMHASMLLAVLGIAGTFRGAMKLPALFSDAGSLERPNAVAEVVRRSMLAAAQLTARTAICVRPAARVAALG